MRLLLLLFCAVGTFCTTLVLLPSAACAKDDNDAALWLVNQAAVPVDDRFAVHLMVQNRWVRNVGSYQRTVVRPWLSFQWTDEVEVSLGYDAHDFSNPNSLVENRAWQRIAWQRDFGKPTLFTHFWLEERFFEGSDKMAWRGRFQLGGSLDLPWDFGLTVRNEWMVNLNDTPRVRRKGLGENHTAATFSHPLGRWLRIEAGYLMQYLDERGADVFNHTVTLGFAATTPALRDLFSSSSAGRTTP